MSSRGLELLFERFRSHGDVAALGQVFDATAPSLRQVARHLTRDRAEAEDLVQATFLAAIEKRATFDATRELSPWLTGILLKQASLARRARARVVEPDRLGTRDSEDPSDVAAARELSEALTVALARLSASDRDVLIPLLLHGRRAVEIARELGRRPDTIHMRIHRGLARLRRLLPVSFAVAALCRSSQARGLGAVRAEVLRHARLELTVPATASVGATALGIAMSMKKVAALLALVSVLGVGGYLIAARTDGGSAKNAAAVGSSELAADVTGIQAPQATAAARAPALELTDAPPVSRASTTELVIEIVRAGDRAPAQALVALVDAGGTVTGSRTDVDGRCTFDASTGTGHLYVREDAAFPHHSFVELTAGVHTVELPAGEELSGRLVLDENQPFPRIELQLTTDSAPDGLAGADLGVFRALEMLRYDDPLLVARTVLASDGTFRFRVPDTQWGGSLQLPLELVFVDDSNPTWLSGKVIPRPTTGIEAHVAYRPRIVGRLVDAATRAPVTGARFECVLHWSDGNDMLMGSRTSEDGRFTIALAGRIEAGGVTISGVRAPDGRLGRVPESPSWKGPREPFDAGDIEVVFPESRPIEFRAVDPQGAPLPSARASIRELEPVTADDRGVGTFSAVPLEAQSMRVVAPGHAIVTVALTPSTISPLEVVLAPTNSLTIALPPEAAGRSDLRVELVSRALLFGGTSRMYDWNLRGGMVGNCFSADGDAGTKEGQVTFGFSRQGLIVLEGIQTGVPFRVRLTGASFRGSAGGSLAEVAIDSLGPQEHRRIDLVLAPKDLTSLFVLRGLVVDEHGQRIHGAGIATPIASDRTVGRTELDGTFRVDLSDQESVDIEVTKRGYVPFRVLGWNLREGRPLDATLRRGRDLRVELVDENGRAVPGSKLRAEIDGFGPPWRIESGSAGVFTLCDVPAAQAEITIDVAGARYVRSHGAAEDVARIVLPAHGRLEVTWKFGGAQDPLKTYHLALRPLDSRGNEQLEWTPWVDRVMDHVFESVLPGEYTVGLEVDSNAMDDADVYAPLRPPARVTIAAGASVRIEL